MKPLMRVSRTRPPQEHARGAGERQGTAVGGTACSKIQSTVQQGPVHVGPAPAVEEVCTDSQEISIVFVLLEA